MLLRTAGSTLFPYTTLFRSLRAVGLVGVALAAAGYLQVSHVQAAGSLKAKREAAAPQAQRGSAAPRSEEHTSELQSHVNLVCRLLLEKKKGYDRFFTQSAPC